MPPRWPSRHMFCEGIYSSPRGSVVLMLTDRTPFRFRPLGDTITHIVKDGESLYQIAGMYYRYAFERPAGLWWVIADFQPDPIFDPTIALVAGSILFVPSIRTIEEFVINEARREELDE